MREESFVIVVSVFLVLGMGFLVFNNSIITGNVILNNSEAKVFLSGDNFSREDVMVAFNKSEEVIAEMGKNGFSVVYVNDTLIKARIILEQVDYAEVLRGNMNGSYSEARDALRLIDWEDINYGDVMVYLNEIPARLKDALVIYDTIKVLNENIKNYEERGVDAEKARALLSNANVSFYEDRYDEAKVSLGKVRDDLDAYGSEFSIVESFKRGLFGFISKYWFLILILILSIVLILILFYKKLRIYLLRKQINRIKVESQVLVRLMKKAQLERFKYNKIPALVYNIRMDRYRERSDIIKRRLPVLESELRDLTK